MVIVASLVAASVGIIAGTVAVSWRNGNLFETPQERVDREFDRIARRLRQTS